MAPKEKSKLALKLPRAIAHWTGGVVLSGLERVCVPEKEAEGISRSEFLG